MRLVASLPEDSKIGLVFGHLHSPEEAVVAGTGFQLEQTGTGGMGDIKLVTKPIGGDTPNTRSVELFYVPHNEVGILNIGKDGFRFELAK